MKINLTKLLGSLDHYKKTFPKHPINECRNCGHDNTELTANIDNETIQIGYKCHDCGDEQVVITDY